MLVAEVMHCAIPRMSGRIPRTPLTDFVPRVPSPLSLPSCSPAPFPVRLPLCITTSFDCDNKVPDDGRLLKPSRPRGAAALRLDTTLICLLKPNLHWWLTDEKARGQFSSVPASLLRSLERCFAGVARACASWC